MAEATGLKGGVHWDAVLVEAVRVNGEPRQRYVGCLCGIGQQALDGPYRVAVCCGFWDHVTDRLYGLGVAPEAHARIVATLACKVPFPTREEYIARPEFHPWPAHPLSGG